MTPTSTLDPQLDDDTRMRMGGGKLQKSQRLRGDSDVMDTSEDGAATPRQGPPSHKSQFSASNIDPALSGGVKTPSSPGELDDKAVKANEKWLTNVRTIEELKKWVSYRLENHDYDSDEDDQGLKQEHPTPSLYPALPSN